MTNVRSIALAALLCVACGGEQAAPAPLEPSGSGGGEAVVAPLPVPTGPVRSYVAENHQVVLRIDLERVRASAISDDIGSLVRSYPTWAELLGSSGLDPVRDFDRVLVSAETSITRGAVMLIRHHLTETEIREAVLRMSVDRGQSPAWRDMSGISVVEWPTEIDPPRFVALTGEHELVVVEVSELARVVEIARDHQARRTADEMIEPALQLADGTIAHVVAAGLSEAATRRFQHPPESFEVTLRDDLETPGRMLLDASGQYADAAGADAARTYFTTQRDRYSGMFLVRAAGLDRPLREAVIGGEGSEIELTANFTDEEAQRVLGLVALGQMSGGFGGS